MATIRTPVGKQCEGPYRVRTSFGGFVEVVEYSLLVCSISPSLEDPLLHDY